MGVIGKDKVDVGGILIALLGFERGYLNPLCSGTLSLSRSSLEARKIEALAFSQGLKVDLPPVGHPSAYS